MFIKIIPTCRDIVAMCDAELIGKKFEQGKFQLDIKENFYKGEKVDQEKAIQLLQKYIREDATFNIVGKKSIQTAIKAGIISQNSIGRIQNIPFALILI